jgi:excisionase family DNA binding protein
MVYMGAHLPAGGRVKASLAQSEIREVMDIRQASDYLGISADSLYRYAATGFIPAFRLGNRWRFRKSRLDEWMDRRSGLNEAPAPNLVPAPQKKPVRTARMLGRAMRTGS